MIITLLIRALLLHGLRCRNEMSQHFNFADQSFFKNAWIKLQHYCMWGHLRHCCLSCALPWNKTSGGTEACRGSYFNPNMNSYLATRPAAAAVLLSSKAIGTRAFYLHKNKKDMPALVSIRRMHISIIGVTISWVSVRKQAKHDQASVKRSRWSSKA